MHTVLEAAEEAVLPGAMVVPAVILLLILHLWWQPAVRAELAVRAAVHLPTPPPRTPPVAAPGLHQSEPLKLTSTLGVEAVVVVMVPITPAAVEAVALTLLLKLLFLVTPAMHTVLVLAARAVLARAMVAMAVILHLTLHLWWQPAARAAMEALAVAVRPPPTSPQEHHGRYRLTGTTQITPSRSSVAVVALVTVLK
jgi:hypothetical protein